VAHNRRWFVPVRRMVISSVLGIIAIFVICGSAGMHSWRWLSVGIALLAGGVGLAVISAITSTIRGVAHVLAVNEPPAVKHYGRCIMSVIVYAKNTEPIYIKLLEDDVPLQKWPHLGDDLPIAVAASDARVINVLWDRVPTHRQSSMARRRAEAREEAEAAAAEAAEAAAAASPADDPAPAGPDSDDVPTVYAQAVPEPDPVDEDGDDSGDLVRTGSGPGPVLDLTPSEYSVGGDATSTRATAVITSRGHRGKPSPRPRPAADDMDLDATETVTSISFEAPTEPIHIGHVGLVSPAVAPPDDDAGHDDDTTRLANAYRAAAPPPGATRRGSGITVTLLISDLSRSIVFYRDILGFREVDAGRGTAVLEFGDARVLLRVVEGATPTQRLVQMLLEVPDVDATYQQLLARGVSFLHRPRRVGQYEQLELRAAAFRDPDGHGIAIAEWREI
jgi:resuscitation-promoting factor RpfA